MMNIQQVSALPPIDSSLVAVDIETTRLYGKDADPYRDRIVSVQVSDGDTAWILRDNFLSLVPILTNPNIKKLGHNFSFDAKFLMHHLGIGVIDNIHDTLMAERLITAGDTALGNGLEEVLARRCGVFTDKTIRDQFSMHRGQFTAEQLEYMAKDVLYLHEIRRQQLEEISRAGMGKVLAIENSIVGIIAQMELDGVGFDRELWAKYCIWIEEKLEEIKLRVAKRNGISYIPILFGGITLDINLNSSNDVQKVLASLVSFDELFSNAPTAQALMGMSGTGEDVLEEIKHHLPVDHPGALFISDVLEWRGWQKLITSDYPKYVNPVTGRIHTNWNQIKADTGRFSSSGPNLQNVRSPQKDEPNFRHLFPPKPGYVYVVADYSQQEIRILAQISGDEKLRAASFASNIYVEMGRVGYGREIQKGTPEYHQMKTVVLADAYGSGPPNIASRLGSTLEVAKQLQSEMRRIFPQTYRWLEGQSSYISQHGYVKSLLGRRRWVKQARGAARQDLGKFERIARNMPIQGSAADIGKEAMRRYWWEWASPNGYTDNRLDILVHDELVAEARVDQAEEVLYNLKGAMEISMEYVCPDVKAGVEAQILPLWDKV